MSDKTQEYLMLRKEIDDRFSYQNNFILLTYTITITVFGWAFTKAYDGNYLFKYIFLLPLIIIIPNIFKITFLYKLICSQAAYLIVFHETDEDGIMWESRGRRLSDFENKKTVEKILDSLHKYSLAFLYLLCLGMYLFFGKSQNTFHCIDIIFIVILLFLFIICIGQIHKSEQWSKVKDCYMVMWKKVRDNPIRYSEDINERSRNKE